MSVTKDKEHSLIHISCNKHTIHLMPCTKHTKSKLRLQILIKCAACTVMMHHCNLVLDIKLHPHNNLYEQ